MAYSNELKALLSAGKGVSIAANLVDDSGNSNLPDGTKTTFKMNKKFSEAHQVLLSTDNGVTWVIKTHDTGYGGYQYDTVNNTITFGTAPDVGDLIMISLGIFNQPAISIPSPKPIQTVDRDLIASNHHSVYAYNGLTYAASGKVATGSSFESKGVDIKGFSFIYYDIGESVTINTGDIVSCTNLNLIEDKQGKGLFKRVGGDFSITVSASYVISNDANYWVRVGTLPENYQHQTLTLDNQSIVASKSLLTQTSNATQVFTQEMVWDATNSDWGDSNQFDQLTSGTTPNLDGVDVQTKVLLKPSSINMGE